METALLQIVKDMFEAVDLGHTTILITRDLSTVFDNRPFHSAAQA